MKSFLKKTFIFIIAAVVVVSGFGLTLEPVSAASGPSSIYLKVASGSGTSAVVDINGKVKVYVSSVYPSTSYKSVNWSVYSGSTYGKISSTSSTYCYVQGIKAGTVTIKAKSKYYPYATKYIKVYVKQLYPTKVSLNRTSFSLWKGSTYTLTPTVTKASWVYNGGVSWKSSYTSVATVTTAGKVTAAGTGSTTITATSKDLSTLKAYCKVYTFSAALTKTGRIDMAIGDADISNPLVVKGLSTISRTITYTSSNPAAATVDSAGKVHAVGVGSTTITAKVTIPSIATGDTTKTFTYYVNVKKPLGTNFTFKQTWAYLEITQNTTGYLAGTKLMLSPSQLDDLFGYGSLGMNIWDPMDMYFNFQAKDISWHAGDFAFDKVKQADATLADVEILPDKDAALPTYHPYWLDDTAGDKNCVDLFTGAGGVVTGYEILFYYENTLDGAFNSITLNNNALTLKFETSEMKLVRSGLNQVQAYATVDGVGTLDDLVLTITRSVLGYNVVVNNTAYINQWGIKFNGYYRYK